MVIVFGEIISFESSTVPLMATVFALFKVKGRAPEVTLISRGMHGDKDRIVFPFNRPIIQVEGQRMFFQLIQNMTDGTQALLGYGLCDLSIPEGDDWSRIDVRLLKPRSQDIERENSTITEIGKLVLHIQKPGYI